MYDIKSKLIDVRPTIILVLMTTLTSTHRTPLALLHGIKVILLMEFKPHSQRVITLIKVDQKHNECKKEKVKEMKDVLDLLEEVQFKIILI